MEILLLLFLLIFLFGFLFLLYKIVSWIGKKRVRVVLVLSLVGIFLVVKTIDYFFFTKIKFIQSKVYPDLYLIKNPIKDKGILQNTIKDFVITTVKDNEKATVSRKVKYPLRFYKYVKSWNPLVFGDSGTAYFIENEEDLGGMVVEDLSIYTKHKLATFMMIPDKKDTTFSYGILAYYKEGYVVKTDTLKEEKLKLSAIKLKPISKIEATKRYGTPHFSAKFNLNDAQGEFRNGISDCYTQEQRQTEVITINEITWEKDNNNWITFWYEVQNEKNIPKHVLIWKKGAEF